VVSTVAGVGSPFVSSPERGDAKEASTMLFGGILGTILIILLIIFLARRV
jgi:nitrate reductase gamma subunit